MLAAALHGTALQIATAESCTGGQLAALLARDIALGPHLDRGFVAYSARSKCELLGVDRAIVERCDAVYTAVAEALMRGAIDRSDADLAIGITGFCGPREKDEEVGLVYIGGGVRGSRVEVHEFHFGDQGRDCVLDAAVAAALDLLAALGRDAGAEPGKSEGDKI